MITYYRYFHSKGPIPWKYVHEDIELNNKVIQNSPNNQKTSGIKHVRSFKSTKKDETPDIPR